MKRPWYIFLLVFVFPPFFISAQNVARNEQQAKAAADFINAYNRQDYRGMKRSFFALGRLLPIKKALQAEFGPRYEKFGKAKIDAIHYSTGKGIIVELRYENDKYERDNLALNFNAKNKLAGLGFRYPDYLYPKNAAFSAQKSTGKIDSLMRLKHAGFNGNVLVLDNGSVIYKKSFGYADYDKKEPLNDSSVFELASCSKQFTAMAIMILKEKGKLNYTDNIQKYIPELPYQNITIEHLLTHTSGLPDYMELMAKYWDKKKFATNNDIVNLLKQHKPRVHFAPNELYEYSNTGYALLSSVIESVRHELC